MRDIKFRAFNGDRIVKVNTIGWTDGEIDWVDTSKNDDFDEDMVLMQYTGVKDINGVEVYEGDILKWTDFELNNTTINPVYLEGVTPIFNVNVDELIYATTLLTLNKIKDGYFEVIGNIYENPELLED